MTLFDSSRGCHCNRLPLYCICPSCLGLLAQRGEVVAQGAELDLSIELGQLGTRVDVVYDPLVVLELSAPLPGGVVAEVVPRG